MKDHLGSIRMTVNDAGNVISYDDYYPFGLTMPNRSGSYGDDVWKYKFTGKERDVETGLDYFGARYYNAMIGRWMSVDLMNKYFPNISPFVYVHDDPINRLDSDGKVDWKLVKDGAIEAILGYGTAVGSGYAIANSGGTLAPVLGTIGLMGGLTGGSWGMAHIIAGIVEKRGVLEEGLISTTVKNCGGSDLAAAYIGTGVSTFNLAIDVVSPVTGIPKLLDYLNKIADLKDLSEETQNYIKQIIKQIEEQKKKEEQEKQEDEKKKQKDEKKKQKDEKKKQAQENEQE